MVIVMPRRKTQLDPIRWQDAHRGKSVSLSARQYTLALEFDQLSSRVISAEYLDAKDQGIIRSFYARGYIRQQSTHSVYWTREGSEAVRNHVRGKTDRHPTGRFSSVLSLEAYDRKSRENDKVA